MNIPKKIDPCPIIDCVIEIRFETNVFPNAVFGILYNLLKDKYTVAVEKLPILQVPEQLREIDPQFKYKAHYKLSDGKYSIQIGSNVLIIGSPVPYNGWTEFSAKIFECLDTCFKSGIITSVNRLGFRVINFFEFNIYKKINLTVNINKTLQTSSETIIRTLIENGGYSNILQISNNVVNEVKGQQVNGSVIDIDTYKEYSDNYFLSHFETELTNGHNIEKEIFFMLLEDAFLKSLNPEY